MTFMKQFVLATLILILGPACEAQEQVNVRSKKPWPADEVQKIYASSCAAVQHEYGQSSVPKPQLTLVLGADKNELVFGSREIRLKHWDPLMFAQGVVLMAFEDLMPLDQRLRIAKRAVGRADATVTISQIRK